MSGEPQAEYNAPRCAICRVVLDSAPEHRNLGGDCLMCMAACDDPDAVAELERLRSEANTPNPH